MAYPSFCCPPKTAAWRELTDNDSFLFHELFHDIASSFPMSCRTQRLIWKTLESSETTASTIVATRTCSLKVRVIARCSSAQYIPNKQTGCFNASSYSEIKKALRHCFCCCELRICGRYFEGDWPLRRASFATRTFLRGHSTQTLLRSVSDNYCWWWHIRRRPFGENIYTNRIYPSPIVSTPQTA